MIPPRTTTAARYPKFNFNIHLLSLKYHSIFAHTFDV